MTNKINNTTKELDYQDYMASLDDELLSQKTDDYADLHDCELQYLENDAQFTEVCMYNDYNETEV